MTAAKSKQEVESIAQRKSKKKKKGKKQKGDSYSDLPVYAGDDTGNPGQNELHNMEATQSALECELTCDSPWVKHYLCLAPNINNLRLQMVCLTGMPLFQF